MSCEVCEAVAAALDEVLVERETVEAIEKAIEKVCHYVSPKYHDQCYGLIEMLAPQLLQLLLELELRPDELCEYVHLCSDENKIKVGCF